MLRIFVSGLRMLALCGWVLFGVVLGQLSVNAAEPSGGQSELVWLSLQEKADIRTARDEVHAQGGKILTLTPERRLLVRVAPKGRERLGKRPWVRKLDKYVRRATGESAPTGPKGLGLREATPEEKLIMDQDLTQVETLAPNQLSVDRTLLLDGEGTLPATVDNSLSQYFPPIGNQASQGSCTAWASGYYYDTYCHAMDEGLDASGGDDDVISSPAFLYNLANNGIDNGSSIDFVMYILTASGCCRETLMPYKYYDYTSWPSEEAWLDGLERRSDTRDYIGGMSGNLSDESFLAIKQHLANGYIGVTRTDIYSNMYDSYPSKTTGINNEVLFANSGSYVGGHAMTLVGYDDDKTYNDGTSNKSGAFLVANSWTSGWGSTNTAGDGGFMWVGYDYFKSTPNCFGIMFYNTDLPQYRPRLYTSVGLNHNTRGDIFMRSGLGTLSSPECFASAMLWNCGGDRPIDDSKRVVQDMTDVIDDITDMNQIQTFVYISNSSSSDIGTITSADFYQDFDGDGIFSTVSSTDPVVTISPGATGTAEASFGRDDLTIEPYEMAMAAGPEGGPYNDLITSYTLTNNGSNGLDWAAQSDEAWLTFDPPSGTLTAGEDVVLLVYLNSAADSLPAGENDALISIVNQTASSYQDLPAHLTCRPISAFAWDPIASPQGVNAPIDVNLKAVDEEGLTVRAFNGEANVSAIMGDEYAIGDGTNTSNCPYGTYFTSARYEVIYTASELGAANQIISLALDCTTLPTDVMEAFTLRMKHTSLSTFPNDATWDTTDWTVVYENDLSITSLGWNKITFQTPFDYNGTDNVIIDFSFHNGEIGVSEDGYCSCFSSNNRVIYYRIFNSPIHPKDYDSSYVPTRAATVPNLKLFMGQPVGLSQSTCQLTDGIWTGQLKVLDAMDGLVLTAEDGNNHGGHSNAFDVITCPMVQTVSSPQADDFYGTDSVIDLQVAFSEAVAVTGSPRLELETGEIDRAADYVGGSETNTLTFQYVVADGDISADLDYLTSTALTLNGGTITATGGTQPAAILTLPVPGMEGSLGYAKNLVIDTVSPVFDSLSIAPLLTRLDTVVELGFTASEALSANPVVMVNGHSATYVDQVDNTYTYSYTIQGSDPDGQATITVSGADYAGNVGELSNSIMLVVDQTPPTVIIESTADDLTNISPIAVTVTFSESVDDFDAADVTPGNATVENFGGTGTAYQFDLVPAGQGLVTVDVSAEAAHDAAGNPSTAAVQLTRTYDSEGPTVTLSSTADDPTSASTIAVTVTFSESVDDFDAADVTPVNATVENFGGTGTAYQFDLVPAGQGLVTVDVSAEAAHDAAGNPSTAAVQLTRTYDSEGPTVTLSSTADDPTSASTIAVTVTFSESVDDFDAADVTPVNATVENFGGTGPAYQFDLVPAGQGLVTVDVSAEAAHDAAGNPSTAAVQLTRTFDSEGPTVTLSSTADDPTSASTIAVTVTFSESVDDFDAADVTPGNATVENFGGTGTAYQFDLVPAGQGLVTVDVSAEAAHDAAGNPSTAAVQLTRTYDSEGPTVTLTTKVDDPTNISPIAVTMQTSEPVSDFGLEDISVLNATVENITGSDNLYYFDLIPIAPGEVSAEIPVGAVHDALGNPNTIAAQFSRTYEVQNDLVVWVDFAWSGAELGTEEAPYRTLTSATQSVSPNGTIRIKGDTADNDTNEILRITTPMRIEAVNGSVRIGVPTPLSDTTLYAAQLMSSPEIQADESTDGIELENETDRAGTTFEPVMPATMIDATFHAAKVDSPLAIRLRSDVDIAPDSIQIINTYLDSSQATMEWRPAQGAEDMRDVWVILRPKNIWYFNDVVSLKAQAKTVNGDVVGPVKTDFRIESPEAFVERMEAPPLPVLQPEAGVNDTLDGDMATTDSYATAIVTLADAQAPIGMLSGGIDTPFVISPEQVYAQPQRVWLPMLEKVSLEKVNIHYYKSHGEDRGWYRAEDVECWLVPGSLTHIKVYGTTYIGFLIRHAGIVQLGVK